MNAIMLSRTLFCFGIGSFLVKIRRVNSKQSHEALVFGGVFQVVFK